MPFDVRISEYPASDVVRVAARNSLDGSLIFADQVFRPAVRHPDFGGAGLYAVFCGTELIYIGKYLGLQNDFSGGNIIDQRWTKHLGTFTMRTRNLGFSKRALSEITAHLAGCAHEIPTAIETGFRDARSEVLLQKTGCMTTFQRFLVASRIWQQTNGDVTLDDFKFVYARIDSDLPVGVVRALVTKAEDAALDIIHPDGNTIAKRRDTMLPRVTELTDLFKGFLTDANLSFKAWADTTGKKLETTWAQD